jgi:hypothetical protein
MHDSSHIALVLGESLVDAVRNSRIDDDVFNAHRESLLEQPVVDNKLSGAQEVSAHLKAILPRDQVRETRACGSDDSFSDFTTKKLSFLNKNI